MSKKETFFISVQNELYWEFNEQTELECTRKEAIFAANVLAKLTGNNVRLSTTRGYNNSGSYIASTNEVKIKS